MGLVRNNEVISNYFCGDIIYASLYTAIFPPVLLSKSTGAVNHYQRFVTSVQAELLELLEFCFDWEYYPAVLGDLHPAERFAIYNRVKGHLGSFTRTEKFTQDNVGGGSHIMPLGMSAEQHKDFQNQFGLSDGELSAVIRFPTFISISYKCGNLYNMLLLEFTKMLECGVRFKKCKNCGRYFILNAIIRLITVTAFLTAKVKPVRLSRHCGTTWKRSLATLIGRFTTNTTSGTTPE